MIKNTEIWLPVKGYEGLYEVSDQGRVRNAKTGIFKNFYEEKNRYLLTGLSKNGITRCKLIQRIVAEAFIPNPHNLPFINHRNENKADNRVENLEWCDAKYNNSYGTRIKRQAKSKSRSVAQYTLDGKLVKIYPSIKEAEKETGICNISKCCRGVLKTAGGFIWLYA